MEGTQGRTESSPARRLPFLETVEQLHQHNLRVAEVCFNTSQAMIEAYNSKKQIFRKETEQQEEIRAKASEKLEEDRRKSLEAKQKEMKRRNQQNISKLEHYLADKKAKRARKEKELMEGSSARRQTYLQNMAASFHHSQDRRNKIEVKQEGELKRSLLLMERNEEKIRTANYRKNEFLENLKNATRLKNFADCGAAISLSKAKESEKRDEELQKLILKYDSSAKHLSQIGNISGKLLSEKKKEQQKNLQKHKKKRSQLQEDIQRKREEEARKCCEKLEKVNACRDQKVTDIASKVENKRKQKQKSQLYNTFYLHEEAGKKADSIIHKHYNSQMFLTSIKFERQKLHKQNLHDSFRATIRS